MASTTTQPAPSSNGTRDPRGNFPSILPPLFFAALFFLCCADTVFTTRIHGYNFRWGQLLLLGAALLSAGLLTRRGLSPSQKRGLLKQIGLAWLPFALSYFAGACLSTHPELGLLKWGWALFNIGGAALVVLGGVWPSDVRKGFRWAILFLAAWVLLQSLCLFVFPGFFQVTGGFLISKSFALTAHPFGLNLPMGIGQFIANWGQASIYRPCVLYYEPNYLSGALALSLPLLILQDKATFWYSGWAPGLIVTAVVLTTSRGGILGCGFALAILGAASLLGPLKEKRVLLLKTVLFAGMGLGLFLLSPGERHFLDYLSGPLGPAAIQEHALTPHTSEGDRLLGFIQGVKTVLEHPLLGQGYQPIAGSSGMAPGSLNTWIEIGLESGFLGLLGFVFAVLWTIRTAIPWPPEKGTLVLLLTAWTVLFGINYNLSSNFPRLDFWLLFFYAVLLARTAASE